MPIFPLRPYAALLLAVVTAWATLGAAGASGARAQDSSRTELVIPRLDGPIVLDGRVEDAAWDAALRLPVVQHMPTFGEAPSEETEILIGYTDEAVYIACRCYDRQTPSATSFKRNYFRGDSDLLVVILDTFNDNENGVGFITAPTGLRSDAAVSNDASGPRPVDPDWNAAWDVATHQNEEGWFAEMRIPLSSLRFEAVDDQVIMGLITWRWLARNSESMIFPAIPRNWGVWSGWKVSQAQKVVLEGLRPRRLLQVTPYLLGGAGQLSVLNTGGTAYQVETDPTYDVGLDVKYGLTSNLTLDLTLNTDFAQAEADDQEVNLTRFPLFFPEKRRFFLERASTFSFQFSGSDRLFYSRRIGLHAGQPTRILGGARLVGRVGAWDVGVLNMQTGQEAGIGPGGGALGAENFGVARLRRQVLNPYSYVGGIVTSRLGAEGMRSVAYGLDGVFRVTGEDYLTVKWAQSFDDERAGRLASLDPSRVLLQWERRSYEGLSYDFRYDRAGARYHPAVGFQLREDYFRIGDRVSYGWLPGLGSVLQSHRSSLITEAFFRNADGSLESLEVGPQWEGFTKGGHTIRAGVRHHIEDLPADFPLSADAAIPAGRHAFQTANVYYGLPGSRRLRAGVGLAAGGFYDGSITTLRLTPSWAASRYVTVSGAYEQNRLTFSHRDEHLTSHVGRLRLELTPNVRYSLQTFLQYNSAIDGLTGNVRFRYNPREGNDLYVVFNEQLNTNRYVATPHLPLSGGRTVLVKYTYTLGW